MKRALLAAALGLTSVTGHADPAQDEKGNEKIVGLARIVCAQAAIVLHCRKLYTVDDQLSEDLSRTASQTLDHVLGAKQAADVTADESARVAREIDELGEDRWCADQRAVLNADGVRIFVD